MMSVCPHTTALSSHIDKYIQSHHICEVIVNTMSSIKKASEGYNKFEMKLKENVEALLDCDASVFLSPVIMSMYAESYDIFVALLEHPKIPLDKGTLRFALQYAAIAQNKRFFDRLLLAGEVSKIDLDIEGIKVPTDPSAWTIADGVEERCKLDDSLLVDINLDTLLPKLRRYEGDENWFLVKVKDLVERLELEPNKRIVIEYTLSHWQNVSPKYPQGSR